MKLKEYLRNKPLEFTFELYSSEEEHEVATLEENPLFTWDIEFQEEWKEVFEAEILEHTIAHKYNAEIFVIGCGGDLLERFLFTCAGFTPASYWDEHHLEIE